MATIDRTAWVAPTAVLAGDVTLGPGARVLHGAVLNGDHGPIVLGENVLVMENALLRGRIHRSRSEVATYAANPDNATVWYVNIKGVQWKTPRPLALGSQFEFTAAFLGRRLTYGSRPSLNHHTHHRPDAWHRTPPAPRVQVDRWVSASPLVPPCADRTRWRRR
jgi:hypothetical protein